MTEQDEFSMIAQELIGTWIRDKTSDEYLYVCDYYNWERDGDVKLCCIAIYPGDGVFMPYIKDNEVWMSEFKEYYRKVPKDKGIKAWKKIKEYYDKVFMVEE